MGSWIDGSLVKNTHTRLSCRGPEYSGWVERSQLSVSPAPNDLTPSFSLAHISTNSYVCLLMFLKSSGTYIFVHFLFYIFYSRPFFLFRIYLLSIFKLLKSVTG